MNHVFCILRCHCTESSQKNHKNFTKKSQKLYKFFTFYFRILNQYLIVIDLLVTTNGKSDQHQQLCSRKSGRSKKLSGYPLYFRHHSRLS